MPTSAQASQENADLRERIVRYDRAFAGLIEQVEAQMGPNKPEGWNEALSAVVDILEEIKDQEAGE